MPSAFKINPVPPSAPDTVLNAFRGIPRSQLSDNLQRFSGICGLTRLHRSSKPVGTALTVRTRPGDNLLLRGDGVATFPLAIAEGLVSAANKTAEMERAIKAEIANGKREQSWLERVLAPHGLEGQDQSSLNKHRP